MKKKFRLSRLPGMTFVYFIMIFTVIVSVFPFIWVLISSFKTNKAILGSPFTLPTEIDFTAFADVLSQYNFLRYGFNSLYIAVISTIISLVIYSMSAYIFAKFEFKGKDLLYILFTVTILVPSHAKAQPIFSLISKLKLYDTKSALIAVYSSFGMALALFILRAAFKTIPKELDEAALIDGASFWQVFWNINLPLVKSGVATAGILMFLTCWNEYFYAVILTSSSANRTLPVALRFFNEAFSYNYTRMFAAITMVVLPGIILYLFAQEQVQKSIASSGIKG